MDLLIIGGLFVIALLAIVGVIFVIRTDNSPRTTPKETVPTPAPASAPMAPAQEVPANLPVAELSAPSPVNTPVPAQPEADEFPSSNGQFHEFSTELQTLHEQSKEMEDRLNRLTEMIERIEHSQDTHVNMEETFLPRDTPSIN